MKSPKTFCLLLPLLILLTGAVSWGLELRVNGRTHEADTPYFQIQPGCENPLEIKAIEFAGGEAVLMTSYPDGKRHVQRASVDAEGNCAFQLGRFATPARYIFQGGDVLRQGTRFTLTLTTWAERQVVHFYQGPARQEKTEALWLGEKAAYPHDANGAVVAGRQIATVEWAKQEGGRWTATLPPLSEEALEAACPPEEWWPPVIRIRRIIGEFVLHLDGKPPGGRLPQANDLHPVDIPLPQGMDFSVPHKLELRPVAGEIRLARGTGVVCIPWDRIPLAERGEDGVLRYAVGGAPWRMDFRRDRGKQMNPPFQFSLAPSVLENQNDVTILLRSDPYFALPEVQGRIEVRRLSDGAPMIEPIAVTVNENRRKIPLNVTTWIPGDYEISLKIPSECGCEEGSTLRYHRAEAAPEGSFAVSPYAPWRLTRDASRDELVIDDFAKAVAEYDGTVGTPDLWEIGKELKSKGDAEAAPVVIHPPLKAGAYAVWVKAMPPPGIVMYVQLGTRGDMRPVLDSDDNFPFGREQFLGLIDGDDNYVAFTQFGAPRGLASLRFTPVTADSVAAFRQQVENPPCSLGGICDFMDAFVHAPRIVKDAWDNLAASHRDIGIREIQWAIGRSTLLYHTNLPGENRFPAIEPPEKPVHLRYWQTVMQKFDPLAEMTEIAAKRDVVIAPWLTMNRHYGEPLSDSAWFKEHMEWHEHRKHNPTATDNTRACFFFPEVRRERINIFMEVVRNYPVDRIVLGGCRQQPMLAYHPAMVAAYKAETGVDPEAIDGAQEEAYTAWVTWRANFFTQLLRELRAELAVFEKDGGRAIKVIVRMPAADKIFSLAQGFDVETWMREKLVDRIELEGAEDFGGRSSMDVSRFVALGHEYGVPVWGGVNSNCIRSPEWSPAAAMRRALAQYDAGVSGLQIYESNNWHAQRPVRWFLPLLGNPEAMRKMLAESNLEAVWPTVSTNCFTGIDNHSNFDAPSPCAYDICETGRHEL